LNMRAFILISLLPSILAATTKTINVLNNCPNVINFFTNPIGGIAFQLPAHGSTGIIDSDPTGNVSFSISANNGTLVALHFGTGEYFIQKNTAFFDVGISVTPADAQPQNGFCPTVTCDDVSCTSAFTATPTLSNVFPTAPPAPPLFACPTANIYNLTFCPSGVQPDQGSLPRAIFPKGIVGKCLDVQGNVQEDGTPVQVFDCNGSTAQQWLIAHGNTQVKLAGTNFCLDAGSNPANFVGMKIFQCFEGLPQQSWFYTDDERIAVTNMGLCLDVPNGNLTNGQQLQTFTCTDNDQNQFFTS